MIRCVQIYSLLGCLLLIAGCGGDEPSGDLFEEAQTGVISGNISPINVYDAEVTLFRGDTVVAVVGVQDGIFRIDNLPAGQYSLRITALGYVTNDAINDIEVIAGEEIDVGRAVIYPAVTSGIVPTRLTGVVQDALTGAPVADATVEVECLEGLCGVLNGVSDAEGNFTVAIWANLASVVKVEKEGYRIRSS